MWILPIFFISDAEEEFDEEEQSEDEEEQSEDEEEGQ